MENKNSNEIYQGSLFEEDYLIRSLGQLAHSPDIALTELVANAWDAGATKVDITIPDDYNFILVVEDNGTGITKSNFENRWMRLGYNRLKSQGKNVVFPKDILNMRRQAYGRNGVGRHGLLCFNNEYKVITIAENQKSTYTITTKSEEQPFIIKDANFEPSIGHGTRLEVIVVKNLPKPEKILEVISARFLHDPNFVISINSRTVPLSEHTGLIDSTILNIEGLKLTAHLIDSLKSAKSTLYQGIAFWQGKRLVGEPSWILGNEVVVDGRTKFAKRFTIVIETIDLADQIYEDWSGFKRNEIMENVFSEITKYVNAKFTEIARDNIEETKSQVKNEFLTELSDLTPLAKYEVNEAINAITLMHPTVKPEAISIAVEAIINLEKSRSGKELLVKLSKLTEDDIEGLNLLLDKWTVRDALSVLDEIDNRISVIEAIRKLSKDNEVDELHVLHPLVTAARWLFGPEYESAEYSSNQQLQNAIEKVFKKKLSKDLFNNHKQRPDIVILKDSIASITGTEIFDNETSLLNVNKVLIIELKRGKFKLTREERNQAQGYVEDFINCGSLINSPYIDAYVVGDSFSEKVQPISTVQNENKVEMGKIRITTFGQLVDSAEKRLFGLRRKLNERYDDIPGMELFKKQGMQMETVFIKNGTDS